MEAGTELLKLAERCEAAEGPSVDLFRDVFAAIHGPKPERVHGGSAELTAWLYRFNPFYELITRYGWLDAAMTLVPERHSWAVEHTPDGVGAWCYDKEVHNSGPSVAATPALALCAAALRARAALKEPTS